MSLSAVLGWAIITALVLYPSDPSLLARRFALVPWAALLGLPIAFIACWLIGAPLLWRLMRHSILWRSAAAWGGLIGGVIFAAGFVIGRIRGHAAANNPDFSYQIGGGEFVQEADGFLTSYGWWIQAQGALIYVLIGTAVALIVRWVIGPGRVQSSSP